ncbi:hypothetical protein LUZ61_017339 [Rhynchospora tenuis]|uniref:Uncharacterized protein n=1 Tax=Rhynchospora tenuis TaxID=198213 RepID=A0AAD5Z799_9POAL|nr:hypothetical protein LUZ61_017339 [Rhynchospora tenuis]
MLVQAPAGTIVSENGVVTCSYPKDHIVLLGALSIVALFAAVGFSLASLFARYKGNAVNLNLLLKCSKLKAFFGIAWLVSFVALALTLWPMVSENHLLNHNIYHTTDAACPTAKTGMIGGAGMISFCASSMWFIVFMLSQNRKTDIYDEEYESHDDESIGSFHNA